MNKDERYLAALDILGMSGVMLSGSKTGYSMRNPNSVVFFNGNVFDADANKLWFGDFDLTLNRERLERLAAEIGCPVYLTRETPYRFDPPTAAQLEQTARVSPRDVVRIEPSEVAAKV